MLLIKDTNNKQTYHTKKNNLKFLIEILKKECNFSEKDKSNL